MGKTCQPAIRIGVADAAAPGLYSRQQVVVRAVVRTVSAVRAVAAGPLRVK